MTRPRVLRAFFTVLLSLLCPIVWMYLNPSLSEDEPIKLLAEGTDDRDGLEIPSDVISLNAIESHSFKVLGAPMGIARYNFQVAEKGRYAVYATSTIPEQPPIKILVNDELIASWVFFHEAAPPGSDLGTHLISTNVELRSGINSLELDGLFLDQRTFLVYLYRQNQMSMTEYAVLFALVLACLLMRHVFVDRVSLPPGTKLVVIVSAVAVVSVFGTVLLYQRWGIEIGHWGVDDTVLASQQRDLDDYLASSEFHQDRNSKFTVCVMGDSTHIFPPTEPMLDLIQKKLLDDHVDDTIVYGLAGAGFSAYDYYFLMNRVVREQPDVVVIPVSLRSFGDRWLYQTQLETPRRMERYLNPSQFYVGLTMRAGRRMASLAPILLDKVDMLFFHSRGLDFVNGLRSKFEDRYWPQAKPSQADTPEAPRLLWNENVTNDHDLLEAFKNINRLARSHQISILYYSEQVNVRAQKRYGEDPRLQENYEFILNQLKDSDNIYTLHLAKQNPPGMFYDISEHLNLSGRADVAGKIAQKIHSIKDSRE